jgi:hypothetical protein
MKVDKSLSPQAEKSTSEPSKPLSPKSAQGLADAEDAPPSPTHIASSCDIARTPPRLELVKFLEAYHLAPGPMDAEHLVGRNPVKAHPFLSPGNNIGNIRMLQSPYGDNPDFIQAGFHIGQYITAFVNTKVK